MSAPRRLNIQHAARCTNGGNDEPRGNILKSLGGQLWADLVLAGNRGDINVQSGLELNL